MLGVLSIVTASLLIAADAPREDKIKNELAKLKGTWLVVAIEVDGKQLPAEVIRKRNETFTFKGDTVVQRTDKPEEHRTAEGGGANQESFFSVKTSRQRTVRCRVVVMATGFFDHPNLMGVPGEERPKVSHYYDGPFPYYGQRVAVIAPSAHRTRSRAGWRDRSSCWLS